MIPRLFRIPYGCGISGGMRAEFPQNVWKKCVKFLIIPTIAWKNVWKDPVI
ncbi:MAG TPA: hypothetical protein VE244_14690 [Nitrososphaeraceae archaeon]|nr:hypothetical protein [Nitrososphaeraceae archaeon]